jgi:hypothetical protein
LPKPLKGLLLTGNTIQILPEIGPLAIILGYNQHVEFQTNYRQCPDIHTLLAYQKYTYFLAPQQYWWNIKLSLLIPNSIFGNMGEEKLFLFD